MITLKQLTETIEQEKHEIVSKELDELYTAVETTIKNATSEEQLINSMLAIRKKAVELLPAVSDPDQHSIYFLFSDIVKPMKYERQVFYSLGLTLKQLLFVIRFYDGWFYNEVTEKLLLKLQSLIGLNTDHRNFFDYMYWFELQQQLYKDRNICVDVYYQSANYIIFTSDLNAQYLYVAKL
jgi:hypothetical protein